MCNWELIFLATLISRQFSSLFHSVWSIVSGDVWPIFHYKQALEDDTLHISVFVLWYPSTAPLDKTFSADWFLLVLCEECLIKLSIILSKNNYHIYWVGTIIKLIIYDIFSTLFNSYTAGVFRYTGCNYPAGLLLSIYTVVHKYIILI